MLLTATQDQSMLRSTTDRFLAEVAPSEVLRQRRDDPSGYSSDYWLRGADLGWTSLLASEDQGGGSISGQGLVDLSLIAHEFGRHAAAGPLVPTNVVATALSVSGTHPGILAGLISGQTVVSWCGASDWFRSESARFTLAMSPAGDEIVLNGSDRPVEAVLGSEALLVVAATDAGFAEVLVPTSAAGVSVQPLTSLDLTRRFAEVSLDDVTLPSSSLVDIDVSPPEVAHRVEVAAALYAAESVGCMQKAFEMTLAWAFERYSFGRPLASYQALQHRFAEMKVWLEASEAIVDSAVAAVAADSPDSSQLVSAASAYVGVFGTELLQECVQLHGGVGVTYEHDLHLYLRRHTVDRSLYGTPDDHLRRLASLEGAAA